MTLSSLVRFSLVAYPLLFVVSLVLSCWQGRSGELFSFPGWPVSAVNLMTGSLLAAAVVAGGRTLRHSFEWARQLEEEFRILLGPIQLHQAVLLAVLSGLVEETFFRAVLQPTLGLWVTSILFGLLHYPMNRRMFPWPVIATVLGLALGLVYQSTGSLLAVAVAHGLINFFELLQISYLKKPSNLR